MNYGAVLSRAWQLTRRWKVLWVLGFVAGLGGSVSSGTNVSYRMDETDLARWAYDLPVWPDAALWLALLGCGALLLVLALAVLSVIAGGGLIGGVRQVEDEGSTTLRSAWRVGVHHFWRLFGIGILTGLPVIVLAIAMAILLGLGIAGLTNTGSDSTAGMATASLVSALAGGCLCCVLFPVGLVLSAVATYAQRAAVLEDRPWLDAIGRGWQVLKTNLGPTLLLGLILLAFGLLAGVVLGAVALPIILALAGLFHVGGATAWYIVLAVCAGLLTFAAYGLVGGIFGTFTSASWTLAYREMTRERALAAGAPAEPLPEP